VDDSAQIDVELAPVEAFAQVGFLQKGRGRQGKAAVPSVGQALPPPGLAA